MPLDDIIITGRTHEEHIETLERVLSKLKDYRLRVKLAKCKFFQNVVDYCGYQISKNGISMSPNKIEAIVKMPRPTNINQLKSYCGFINYYRKHRENLSTILYPLYKIKYAEHSKFQWN